MKRVFVGMIFLLIFCLANGRLAFATGYPCGCYCGKYLPEPCSDQACKDACGWHDPAASSAGSGSSYSAPAYDYAAEQQREEEEARQRQAEREEQARKEAEEAKRRQEEFEQKKEDALRSMKGIAENELGLKGVSTDSGLGLKGVGADSSLGLKGVGESGSGGIGLKTLFEKPNGPAAAVDSRVKGESKLDVGAELKLSGKVDSSVVDLRDVKMADVNKGLMKNQWEMSIDPRYKNDPAVQRYINDLWALLTGKDRAKIQAADQKLQEILTDQMKANGRSPEEINDFFAKVHTFLTGEEKTPAKWQKASKLAQDLDGQSNVQIFSIFAREPQERILKKIKNAQAVTADVSYMAPGTQTMDDCVLHAIANGAQVPLGEVKTAFEKTAKDLGMDAIEVRQNPQTAVMVPDKGGRGGLIVFEELLVAQKMGDVVAVPTTAFARAIESTGRPVIVSIRLKDGESHEVAVTGAYRTPKGEIYYRVMDSNLTSQDNFTTYVEKTRFEDIVMASRGGFVVVPRKK